MAQNKKLLLFVMYGDGPDVHPFMVGRRTEKNSKGKYVTREEFVKLGIMWPTRLADTRDDMAAMIGNHILDEIFPPAIVQGIDQEESQPLAGAVYAAHARHVNEKLPWQEDAESEVASFLENVFVKDGKVWIQHYNPGGCPEEIAKPCETRAALDEELYEAYVSGWMGSVPVESGEAAFEHDAESYVEHVLDGRPDLTAFLRE
jgi:hypothetical protein